jgi:isocitrate lyase
MAAYSELQEEEFAAEAEGYAAVKHQSFVGAGYFDDVAQVLSGGLTTTLAMDGSTEEEQFAPTPPKEPSGTKASERRKPPASTKAG